MWDVLTTGIIFLIVGGLKFFDAVWVMENGRPSPATHTMSSLMYAKVFEEYNVGYGTAIAVLLFVLVLIITRIVAPPSGTMCRSVQQLMWKLAPQ